MASDLLKRYFTIVILMILTCVQGNPYSDTGPGFQNLLTSSSQSHFVTRNNTRIIAQRGGLAILPCTVRLNSPATVSWIRRQDFQLLTVGLSTYSSDDRFLVEHARHMGHWSLRIKSVRDEDKGLYECQLSIHPTQSIFVELKVVEAIADIVGAPDLHIDEGSTLRLECKLRRATENPEFVFWYHNEKMVNYDTQSGFSVTSIQSNVNNNHSMIQTQSMPSTSILSIKEVNLKNAGNYTCAPSNARSAFIMVHVLRGEKPAAMQHANRSSVDDVKSNSNSLDCKYHSICGFLFSLYLIFVYKINR